MNPGSNLIDAKGIEDATQTRGTVRAALQVRDALYKILQITRTELATLLDSKTQGQSAHHCAERGHKQGSATTTPSMDIQSSGSP